MNQNASSATHMVNAVAQLIGGPDRMNFLVHISEEAGFVYFANPAACHIRVLASMNMAISASRGEVLNYQNRGDLFLRSAKKMTSPAKEGAAVFADMLDDPDTFKFAFVRNPVMRFLTTYNGTLSSGRSKSPHRKRVFDYLGLQPTQNLTVADLSALLAQDTGLRGLLPNLERQRNLIAYDLVDHSYIGQHEAWERDFALISNHIFGHPITPFDPISTFGQDEDGVRVAVDLDAATLANLETAYSDDFEMIEELTAQGFA